MPLDGIKGHRQGLARIHAAFVRWKAKEKEKLASLFRGKVRLAAPFGTSFAASSGVLTQTLRHPTHTPLWRTTDLHALTKITTTITGARGRRDGRPPGRAHRSRNSACGLSSLLQVSDSFPLLPCLPDPGLTPSPFSNKVPGLSARGCGAMPRPAGPQGRRRCRRARRQGDGKRYLPPPVPARHGLGVNGVHQGVQLQVIGQVPVL